MFCWRWRDDCGDVEALDGIPSSVSTSWLSPRSTRPKPLQGCAVARGAGLLKLPMSEDGAAEVARRSRGTPRIAGRLLRRVRDFAAHEKAAVVTAPVADRALRALEVDSEGLDALDHRYINCIALNYDGGPVGIETISAALSEPRDALEEIVEPYLLQQGLIQRTPRGRMLGAKAWRHLGLEAPKMPGQSDLFGQA